jgi:pyruvate/2-oxoglutarate dehydrogenase complex dihydrolipoamide acyltransferase (E2) component
MSARSPATIDAEAIRAIVAEVLRRLGGPPGTGPAAAAAPSRSSTPASLPAATGAVSGGVRLAGRVISVALLEKLPAGTDRVLVEATAVITPSARDHAREQGIAIERAPVAGGQPAAAATAFVVAHAECGGDAPARAEAIARAVPGAAQLPATGLADVVTAIALHASRDGARGILLTAKPAIATVLANRSASLRAVTARDPAMLAAAAAECAANLLVVDPAHFPAAALSRMAVELAARPATELPATLASRPADCGCKGH